MRARLTQWRLGVQYCSIVFYVAHRASKNKAAVAKAAGVPPERWFLKDKCAFIYETVKEGAEVLCGVATR